MADRLLAMHIFIQQWQDRVDVVEVESFQSIKVMGWRQKSETLIFHKRKHDSLRQVRHRVEEAQGRGEGGLGVGRHMVRCSVGMPDSNGMARRSCPGGCRACGCNKNCFWA